ncbi:MAG: hypothetical protein V1869_01795 [Candidatus Omnitrophota bacterium]
MRDLLFKNLISTDRRRKIIASSEVAEKQGMRSTIRRHFICLVKEAGDGHNIQKPLPHIRIIKEHNTQERREKFFCKIKGSLCAVSNGKLFLLIFMHTLKIDLVATRQEAI